MTFDNIDLIVKYQVEGEGVGEKEILGGLSL